MNILDKIVAHKRTELGHLSNAPVRAESLSEDWGQVILATGVSAITAFVSVRWLLRYIETHTFVAFGWYRIALGLTLIVYLIAFE